MFIGTPTVIDKIPPPTDVVLYIDHQHMEKIANGTKNHDYRKYQLPHTVVRLWFHENKPINAITFMAITGPAKVPGEVQDPTGIGNDDFDNGLKESKFGYPIHELYQFPDPLTKTILKGKYRLSPPPSHYQPPNWLHRDFPPDKLKQLR